MKALTKKPSLNDLEKRNLVMVPDWDTRLKALKQLTEILSKESLQEVGDKILKVFGTAEIAREIIEASVYGNIFSVKRNKHGRKPIGNGLRWKILQRDGFKCVYCGRNSSEVKLHIDHIIPVAKGGKNKESNLVTACVDCNSGKGTKDVKKGD